MVSSTLLIVYSGTTRRTYELASVDSRLPKSPRLIDQALLNPTATPDPVLQSLEAL